ncbi:MAG TPA: hypothetical protein VLU25_07280 [Acidobacteriota bacterium]|nr:hypothetical protein [Acidobacteriota bacterium]
METHVKVFAVLNVLWGGIGVLTAFGLLFFFGLLGGVAGVAGLSEQEPDALAGMTVMALVGAFLFILLGVLSLPSLLAGIGLLQFRTWGRVLGIVVSIIDLMHFPFGTALGIYGLWVLLQPESEVLFNGGRPVSQPARV